MPPIKRLRTLPEPTWTRSDNNLLHKWVKFLAWHRRTIMCDEIPQTERQLEMEQRDVQDYIGRIKHCSAQIKDLKTKVAELKKIPDATDEELAARYAELMALPYVTGTRIGRIGELYVLIDTSKLLPEGQTFGWLEIGAEYVQSGNVYVAGDLDLLRRSLGWEFSIDTHRVGLGTLMRVYITAPERIDDIIEKGDIAALVAQVVARFQDFAERCPGRVVCRSAGSPSGTARPTRSSPSATSRSEMWGGPAGIRACGVAPTDHEYQ